MVPITPTLAFDAATASDGSNSEIETALIFSTASDLSFCNKVSFTSIDAWTRMC